MASALMAFVQGLSAEPTEPEVKEPPPKEASSDDDMFVESDDAPAPSLVQVAKQQQQQQQQSPKPTLVDVARAESATTVPVPKPTLAAIAAQVDEEDAVADQQRSVAVQRAVEAASADVKAERVEQMQRVVATVLHQAAEEEQPYQDEFEPDEGVAAAAQSLAQAVAVAKAPPAKPPTARKATRRAPVARKPTMKDKLSDFQTAQLSLTQRRLLLASVVEDQRRPRTRTCNMAAVSELAKPKPRRKSGQREFSKLDDQRHCRFRPRLRGSGSKESARQDDDDDDGGGDASRRGEDFVRRMEAAERARKEQLRRTREEQLYLARVDKKECPACGNPQSYAELTQKRKKCPNCGVTYRNRLAWSDIADDFLERLEACVATQQPVAEPAQSVEDKPPAGGSGPAWEQVRDEFLGRVQLDLERRELSKAAIWREMQAEWTFSPAISRKAQQVCLNYHCPVTKRFTDCRHLMEQLELGSFDDRLRRDLESRRDRQQQYERLRAAFARGVAVNDGPEPPQPGGRKKIQYVPAASFQERLRQDLQRRREREQDAQRVSGQPPPRRLQIPRAS